MSGDDESCPPKDRHDARQRTEQFSQAIASEALTVEALVGTLKGAKKVIADASREYAERFLYELLQNAYDAQPQGTVGAVKVILDGADGPHGTVYIANTGTPFRHKDFRSISEIAQSSKRPGQGIGNKGVGFKSVLQVAEWPEIYSRSLDSVGAFDGYCFTFARPDDFLRLANGDPAAAVTLADRLSPYGLPVPIEPSASELRALWEEGFASVIRLPLRNEHARELARQQVDEIATSAAPVLLFLDRLGSLTLEVRESAGEVSHWASHRDVSPLDGPDGVALAEVDLGPGGRFLTISRQVDRKAFLAAIDLSVDVSAVDEEWRAWDGEAFVSIALRLDCEDQQGRLYCYLPLGPQALPPFQGYLNAPFVVTLARQALMPSVPLNELLFDAAAEAAAISAMAIRGHASARRLVPDLVAWRTTHVARISTAFATLGKPLRETPLLPIVGKREWGAFATAYRWAPGFSSLTPDAISSATDAEVIDPAIGPERVQRLADFASVLPDRPLDPSSSTVADWAVAIVHDLAQRAKRHRTFDADPWAELYDDLAAYFAHRDPSVLRGRELMIDDDLNLHVTWGGTERGDGASIFFPLREIANTDEPARDASIPKTLGVHLAYVHAGIPWTSLNPQTRRYENRPGRDFLDRAQLVRLPRTRDLLERIARILARRRDKQLHADALRLVYNLTSGRPYSGEPGLEALNLRVPTTRGKWIPASDGRFSEAWTATLGPRLSKLIRQSAAASNELGGIADRLLARPDDFGFRIDSMDRWTTFLRAVGVRDGLWPVDLGVRELSQQGVWWTSSSLSLAVPLHEDQRVAWNRALTDFAHRPSYPYTEYRLVGRIMGIPGAAEYEALPPAARETFGRIVMAGLGTWPEDALRVRIARPRSNAPDPIGLPSPADVFLRGKPWIPVTRPGEAGEEDFARPANAWHYQDDERDAQPTFMPILVSEVRALVDASSTTLDRARELGLHLWNDPGEAVARLRELSRVFQELEVPDTLVANFRKACERTWATIARNPDTGRRSQLTSQDTVVVSRRSRLGTFSLGGDVEKLHVLVDEDRLTAAVLDALDVPVLRADPRDGEAVARILRPILGEQLRTVAASDVRVLIDGQPVDESEGTPLVDRGREWLSDLVALTLEFKASAFNRQFEQRVRASLETLRAIRLHAGARADIVMSDRIVELPTHLRRVFALSDAVRPRIAFEGSADPLDWSTFERLAPKIGELVGAPSALENAVIVLSRRMGDGLVSAPSDLDYSAAFEESVERVVEVRRAQRGVIVSLLYLLRPVLHLYLGTEDPIGDLLVSDAPPTEPGSLAELLERWESRFPAGVTATTLVEAALSAEGLAQIRDRLGLGYAEFNSALCALAPDYEPLQNREGQALAFVAYLSRHIASLQDRIRDAYLPMFDAGIPPDPYVSASRELTRAQLRRDRQAIDRTLVLAPDPRWLDEVDLPTDQAIRDCVDAWVQNVAPAISEVASGEGVERIRAENSRALASFVGRAIAVLPVWARKRGDAELPPWIAAADVEALPDAFRDVGLPDFRPLDDGAVVTWAGRLGLWPDTLPHTIDPADLGVTVDELAAQASIEQRERLERAQARRTIELDGRPVMLDVSTVSELIDQVRAGISDLLLGTSQALSSLAAITGRGKKERVHGGSGGSRGSRRPTSDQTELIGFMGELVAFEWLRRQYDVGPEAWRSRNRRFAYPDDEGDDSLGYDFEVMRRRPLFFEVKATTSDDMVFEMPETELRVAGENSGNDRYRIIFLRRVNDSAARSLLVLPNPLALPGQGRYRVAGRGIQYEFMVAAPAAGGRSRRSRRPGAGLTEGAGED